MDHSEVYNVARESVGENNLNLMRQELLYVLCKFSTFTFFGTLHASMTRRGWPRLNT
jgi:hypothetical protein